eukprot:6460166-Amphidinium_carterae.1
MEPLGEQSPVVTCEDLVLSVTSGASAAYGADGDRFRLPGLAGQKNSAVDVGGADKVTRAFLEDCGEQSLVGGLRNPFLSICSHPRMLKVGPLLLRILCSYLTSRGAVLELIIGAVQNGQPLALQESVLMEIRHILGRAFKTEDIAAVDNGAVKTPIRA